MSPLTRQSNKAQKIQSVICLQDGTNHKTVTSCHSQSEPVSYEQVIQVTGKEVIDGHKVIVYKVTCHKITGTGLECCQGHSHTYTLCKHSISGVRQAVEGKGKRIFMMKNWENALKRKGQLVKLVGESGWTWGVVR